MHISVMVSDDCVQVFDLPESRGLYMFAGGRLIFWKTSSGVMLFVSLAERYTPLCRNEDVSLLKCRNRSWKANVHKKFAP